MLNENSQRVSSELLVGVLLNLCIVGGAYSRQFIAYKDRYMEVTP